MKSYSVFVTPQALRHMAEIRQYVSGTLQAPDTARALLQTLREEMRALSSLPNRFPLTEEEPWRSNGLHRMLVKSFLVYYWVDEEQQAVRIIAVLYARRDQKQALRSLDLAGN